MNDGEVVERIPGVYFKYDAGTNSWIRLNGYKSINTATAISDGLMPKEDFIKLNRLLLSPPKTNLSTDNCSTTFETGNIRFYSQDGSLHVEDKLEVRGGTEAKYEDWHIHGDTYGYNFRVNLNYLISQMRERSNLISTEVAGEKGESGDRGEPGIDRLDTGPQGEDGESGSNAPFAGLLVNQSNYVVRDKSKVVVDIGTEEVSPDENYLVVYKGRVGSENLCVSKLDVQSGNSSLVLVKDQDDIQCDNPCYQNCGELANLDMDVIVDSIKNAFDDALLEVKKVKEQNLKEWLRTLSRVFTEQKYALCCALENCNSRKRNQNERRYIEQQRLAAAASDFQIYISDKNEDESTPVDHDKVDADMDIYKDCEGPGWQPTVVEPIDPYDD